MDDLEDGLYEHVITAELADAIEKARKRLRQVFDAELDPADSHLYLSSLFSKELERALRAVGPTDRLNRQVALYNELLHVVTRGRATDISPQVVVPPGRLLEAISRNPGGAPDRPSTSLSRTALITGTRRDVRLGSELVAEIRSANQIDAIVSFIKAPGWYRLRPAVEELLNRKGRFRLLTTVYMGASDASALEELASLDGAEVRVSYDTRRTRLHAKAWLFERSNGLSSAYVGSANLSAAALDQGLEWTVKLSEAADPLVIQTFRASFETLCVDSRVNPAR